MAKVTEDESSTPKGPTRLVQFYQFKQIASKYPEVTSAAIIEALEKIDVENTSLELKNGAVRLFDRTPPKGKNVHLELWLSRNDMCGREKGGKEHSLGIRDGSRLLEKAHAILFEDSYLAFLYNHRSAHVEQIANYLNKHCTADLGHLKFEGVDKQFSLKDTVGTWTGWGKEALVIHPQQAIQCANWTIPLPMSEKSIYYKISCDGFFNSGELAVKVDDLKQGRQFNQIDYKSQPSDV